MDGTRQMGRNWMNLRCILEINAATSGRVDLNLSNEVSYLAGKLVLDNSNKNDATWYVPVGDDSYTLNGTVNIIYLSANGSIIDLYHQTPTTVRSSAGDRTFTLNNTKTSANGATLAISTDIANNKADSVVLNGVDTGANTYYVQVVHDASKDTDGTYTATGDGLTVVTGNNANDTVVAKSYTTTKDVAAGLMSKMLTYTPTLITDSGTTKLTSVAVTGNSTDIDGPGQKMANTASMSTQGALSSWRAENNGLLSY